MIDKSSRRSTAAGKIFRQHLQSLILPITIVVIIPFLLISHFHPFGFIHHQPVPFIQIPFASVIFCIGLWFLIITIRLFIKKGRGTLAPWNPTQKFVTDGVYRYTRNPMISGVLFMLIGETIFFGSWQLFLWCVVFVIGNTLYFHVSEEPGLIKRFGEDYIVYRRNVPMWIPRLRPRVNDVIRAMTTRKTHN